jgi:hypothetical protein
MGAREMSHVTTDASGTEQASSVPHGPDLGFKFRIPVQPELPAALAALPGPGFVLLLGKDDNTADCFPWNPMEGNGNELAARGHGDALGR